MGKQTSSSSNPLGISTPFKVLGVVVLASMLFVGSVVGFASLKRSLHSKERTGIVIEKDGVGAGRRSSATYVVQSGNDYFKIEGSGARQQIGDNVTFWAVPGETEADFSKVLPYQALKGFIFVVAAVLIPIILWQVNKPKNRGV